MANWNGDTGQLDPNAPPTIPTSLYDYVKSPFARMGGMDSYGNQQINSPYTWLGSLNGAQGNGDNYTIKPNADGSGFTFTIKNGPQSGIATTYQKSPDGTSWVPVAGSSKSVPMSGNTSYGRDWWTGLGMTAAVAGGAAAEPLGLVGAGAGGAGSGSGYMGVGSSAGSGAGAGFAGEGAAAGGVGAAAGSGAAGGGAASGGSGSGLFGSGITASDAAQLASLAAGALGGKKGGGGSASGGAQTPSNPLTPLSQLGGPSTMFGAPALAGTPPQYMDYRSAPASALWQQYASQLFNPYYMQQAQPVAPAAQPQGPPQAQPGAVPPPSIPRIWK